MQKHCSVIILLVVVSIVHTASAQVGIGWTNMLDLYQYQKAPVHADSLEGSQGSFLINPGFGPKLFIGGKKFSLAVQANLCIALFDLNVNEYKGMGSIYAPIMASLNFINLSGFHGQAKYGGSIAFGIQEHLSELFFKPTRYRDVDAQRFRTYIGQIQFGIGEFGKCTYVYLRYGWNEAGNSNFNIGIATEVNWITNRKYKKGIK